MRGEQAKIEEVQFMDERPAVVEMIDGTEVVIYPGQITVFAELPCGCCNGIVEIKKAVLN